MVQMFSTSARKMIHASNSHLLITLFLSYHNGNKLSISISAGTVATAVIAAGMIAAVVVIMVVAGDGGIMAKDARHKSGGLFIRIAGGPGDQCDPGVFQGCFGPFADTAADQDIHAVFTQETGQSPMAGAAGV